MLGVTGVGGALLLAHLAFGNGERPLETAVPDEPRYELLSGASGDLCRVRKETVATCDEDDGRAALLSVSVLAHHADGQAQCSGVVVGVHHVLTARHCVRDALQLSLTPLAGRAGVQRRATQVRAHPSLDIAVLRSDEILSDRELFELPASSCGACKSGEMGHPLGLFLRKWGTPEVGAQVRVLGYGMRPDRVSGPSAVPARVYKLSGEHFFVAPTADWGACLGDSGAPASPIA